MNFCLRPISVVLEKAAICIAFAGFLAPVNLLADQVFTDDFGSTSYNLIVFNNADSGVNPDDISEAFLNIIVSGGNPGASGQIEHFHDVERDMNMEPLNGDGNTLVQSAFVNQNFIYNPSTDGVIDSISFSIDHTIADFQVSSIYFGVSTSTSGGFAAFSTPATTGNWETETSGTLLQSDFPSIDFAGTDDLMFGFGFISQEDVFFDPTSFTFNVDNFVVNVTSVPEPSSATMVLCAALGVVGLRRRK